MAQKGIAAQVEELIAPLVEAAGMELVDVEYVREHDRFLRVYIDREGGVDLDDCGRLSEQISEVLDEADPIAENYLLEVSSPGVDRIIKKDRDIARFTGRKVDVKLYSAQDGKKEFTAELGGLTEDGRIRLTTEAGEWELERKQIAQMRLHFEF